ncbi:MAG: hypothetical protein LC722_04250 [Actinobacteria bacterium]|nr:hypothetical protein [Actinomycetota bacterium]
MELLRWLVVAVAVGVVLWRLYRGAHSWAQVATLWLTVTLGVVVFERETNAGAITTIMVNAAIYTLVFAFAWKRNAPAPPDEPLPAALSLDGLPRSARSGWA